MNGLLGRVNKFVGPFSNSGFVVQESLKVFAEKVRNKTTEKKTWDPYNN